MNDVIQVVTTTDAKDKAQELAQHLVKLRLAACVQIDGPLESVYRWEDQIETSSEWRLTIKTRRGVYNEVEDAIRAMVSDPLMVSEPASAVPGPSAPGRPQPASVMASPAAAAIIVVRINASPRLRDSA